MHMKTISLFFSMMLLVICMGACEGGPVVSKATGSPGDLIVVMDHGKIVEMGKHEELIHNGGIYQQIYELQSRSASEVSK